MYTSIPAPRSIDAV